ncbi:hypothetical protein B566_EDAN007478 [Ephemera danica]|nr:hypothetical protein B566_EDAN007478 [Ephemera danica]
MRMDSERGGDGAAGEGGGQRRASSQRVPSLKLANGRVGGSGCCTQSQEEIRSPRLAKDDSIKISIENTNTCTDSLVTALDDETLLLADCSFLAHDMNFRDGATPGGPLSGSVGHHGGKVHFGGDDVSLYGTPKEEPGPTHLMSGVPGGGGGGGGPGHGGPSVSGEAQKQSFLKNQLQALFQPTDNKLAMKLFGSKKALMKERIRQKAAGHWVIHPCSNFR